MPLPPQNFSPEALEALQTSALRAALWVEDAQRERDSRRVDARLQPKPKSSSWDDPQFRWDDDDTFEWAKTLAVNGQFSP
jgi:hypothetical protein